jgi:Flp pilus assembly protein TadG
VDMSRRRWICDERGAAAVEFALISTVLILVLAGLLEFGREYSKYQILQGASREGARLAAVRASNEEVLARVNEAAAPYTPTETPTVTTASGASECSVLTRGESVTVAWSQEFHLDIAFWDDVTWTRSIQGVFRCE